MLILSYLSDISPYIAYLIAGQTTQSYGSCSRKYYYPIGYCLAKIESHGNYSTRPTRRSTESQRMEKKYMIRCSSDFEGGHGKTRTIFTGPSIPVRLRVTTPQVVLFLSSDGGCHGCSISVRSKIRTTGKCSGTTEGTLVSKPRYLCCQKCLRMASNILIQITCLLELFYTFWAVFLFGGGALLLGLLALVAQLVYSQLQLEAAWDQVILQAQANELQMQSNNLQALAMKR